METTSLETDLLRVFYDYPGHGKLATSKTVAFIKNTTVADIILILLEKFVSGLDVVPDDFTLVEVEAETSNEVRVFSRHSSTSLLERFCLNFNRTSGNNSDSGSEFNCGNGNITGATTTTTTAGGGGSGSNSPCTGGTAVLTTAASGSENKLYLRRTETDHILVWTGTWNMGNADPPRDFREWFPRVEHDVYVIAVQECSLDVSDWQKHVERQFNAKRHGRRRRWRKVKRMSSINSSSSNNAVESADGNTTTANEEGNFECSLVRVASVDMWQMSVLVYVPPHNRDRISLVEMHHEACGVGDVVGNKGGVGVSLRFDHTDMLFVGSHLAAHMSKIEERNTMVSEIIKSFSSKFHKFKRISSTMDITQRFDHLFWIGDLNYRVANIPREEVLRHIADKDIDILLNNDQLINEMKCGRVFAGFIEAPINFYPSYKFERGNRTYAEEKQRVPSWCDRVLVCSTPSAPAQQICYGSCSSIMTSDHSPVHASFRIRLLGNVQAPEKPRISGFAFENNGSCVLLFPHGFSVRDLTGISRSDLGQPYVKFYGISKEHSVKSASIKPIKQLRRLSIEFSSSLDVGAGKQIQRSRSPSSELADADLIWSRDDVPLIYPAYILPEWLRSAVISFHLMAKYSGRSNAILGSGRMSLAAAVDKEAIYFESLLSKEGKKVGLLSGQVKLRGKHGDENRSWKKRLLELNISVVSSRDQTDNAKSSLSSLQSDGDDTFAKPLQIPLIRAPCSPDPYDSDADRVLPENDQ